MNEYAARYAIARHYLGLVDVDGVLLTERQLQILSSAFPHLAAKLADRATGVAVSSSSNTMMNYLAQYMMDLPSRAEQTPAEFWPKTVCAAHWIPDKVRE